MGHMTIPAALQYVADHPVPATDAVIDMPVWEIAARTLFDIANNPDAKVRGSMVRATKAQKIILDRMVGVRKAGTAPVSTTAVEIDFVDLTQGVIEV